MDKKKLFLLSGALLAICAVAAYVHRDSVDFNRLRESITERLGMSDEELS